MDVLISEVGPRDGLQNVAPIMTLDAKKAWVDATVAAGVREIEVGSFVPAKVLPQLADTAELVTWAVRIPGLTVRSAGAQLSRGRRCSRCRRAQDHPAALLQRDA